MRYRAILVLAGMISVTSLASAAVSQSVNVPRGNLIDGLESLARQYGVDLIYPSEQLEGQKTRGVRGRLAPVEAFRKLLEGTPLVVSEEDGALLIVHAELGEHPGQMRAHGEATDTQPPGDLLVLLARGHQ